MYARVKADKENQRQAKLRLVEGRREQRRKREALKTRGELTTAAQRAFNAFIRARDYGRECISSGKPLPWSDNRYGGKIDAGHYRSVGAAPHLRFNAWNCHAQSAQDNRDKSGNAVDYRLRLIRRIGLERVEALEQDQSTKQYSKDDLRRIARIFNRRTRHYRKLRGLA